MKKLTKFGESEPYFGHAKKKSLKNVSVRSWKNQNHVDWWKNSKILESETAEQIMCGCQLLSIKDTLVSEKWPNTANLKGCNKKK